MKFFRFILFSGIMLICSCSTSPYAKTNKVYKKQVKELAKLLQEKPSDSVTADSMKLPKYWRGSVNFGIRKPNFVIIHHTAQSTCEQTLSTFTLKATQVSAHYVICKDGTLHHMLNDYLRGWHSGIGKWGSVTDVNSSSIGIELSNNGSEPFTDAQINVLSGLLGSLKKKYNIPTANFIGHADIAPGRKVDPSIYFPWRQLSEKGFGYWYGDTSKMILPVDFNPVYALRIIGYDVADVKKAIQSFRIHFLQSEFTGELTVDEKKVLYATMLKYL